MNAHQRRPVTHAAQRGREEKLDARRIPPDLERLVGERLDVGDALEGFLHDGVALGQPVLGRARNGAHFPADEDRHEDDRREAREHHEGEPSTGEDDEHQAAEQERRLPQELGSRTGEGILDLGEVGGDAAGEFAHAALGEEGHGQGDEARVGVAPDVDERLFTDFVEPDDLQVAERRLEDQLDDEHDEHAVEGEAVQAAGEAAERVGIDGRGRRGGDGSGPSSSGRARR